MHDGIELLGGAQVGAERFFDDDPPRAARFVGEAVTTKLLDGLFVELRRGGKVVNARAERRALDSVELGGELGEVVALGDVARVIVNLFGELGPRLGVDIPSELCGGRRGQRGPPGVGRELRAREADDARIGWQALLAMELIEGRHQLAAGEVAGGTEDDESIRHDHSEEQGAWAGSRIYCPT